MDNLENTNVLRVLIPHSPERKVAIKFSKFIINLLCKWNIKRYKLKMSLEEDNYIIPMRWYNVVKEQLVDRLKLIGYEIVSEDVELDHRGPIIHFKKSLKPFLSIFQSCELIIIYV